jgi:hypothetical protein
MRTPPHAVGLRPLVVVFICACLLPAGARALDVDVTARVLAGLHPSAPEGVRVAAGVLQEFSRRATANWGDYERHIGKPMQQWARTELPQTPGGVVFYPFAGPDFATVQRLYPDADRYVLVALQRAEPPPALERASATEVGAFLGRFGESWKQFAQIGFFRTLDLDDEAKHAGLRAGATTPLIAFAARSGFKVVAVDPVRVQASGNDLEVHPGSRSEAATWNSVRVNLERDGRRVVLDYVRVNLSDASLGENAAQRQWIESMAGYRTVLKAASHLLQNARFSLLRDALLTRAPSIVQDETGIEYTRLLQAFDVVLYGRFSKPHPLFNQEAQRALAQAYKAGTAIKPLPFRVSYQRRPEANLQVAVRRSGKTTNTPPPR